MKPVDQTILTEGGDCFPACLASILEIPLHVIPNHHEDDWQDRYIAWLTPYNLCLFSFRLHGQDYHWPWYTEYPGYAILAVESPRLTGRLHAVILHKGKIVHDPHPDRHMGVGQWRELTIIGILDPSRPIGDFDGLRNQNPHEAPGVGSHSPRSRE